MRTGLQRCLAMRRKTEQPAAGPHTAGWRFDPAVLAWGNTVLQAACPCDLLIIDELGPLEFERSEGWLAGLSAIDAGNYRWGVAVIRAELLAAGQRRWPTTEIISISQNADLSPLAHSLAQQLWPD